MRSTITLWLVPLITACDAPDVMIEGDEFHLSSAYVTESPEPDVLYTIQILNVADICAAYSTPGDARPVDDLWFSMSAQRFPRGSTPVSQGTIALCVGERPACSPSGSERLYSSTGVGEVELDVERVRLLVELVRTPDFDQKGPFFVDLDLPIARCD